MTTKPAGTGPSGGLRLATNLLDPARRREPGTLVAELQRLGAHHIHIADVGELLPRDPTRPLAELRAAITSAGIDCSLGIQFISPHHPHRNPTLTRLAHGTDWTSALAELVTTTHAAGIRQLLALVGHAEDRLAGPEAWEAQLHGTITVLRAILPLLRDTGTTILLKSHPDLNTAELLRIIESTDPAFVRVAFDPVNIVTRGEDPLEAARTLNDYTDMIAIDDMIITQIPEGPVRVPTVLGTGDTAWPALLRALPSTADRLIDLKRAAIPLPVDDPAWCQAQGWPDPAAARRRITAHAQRRHHDRPPLHRKPLVYDEPWLRATATIEALQGLLEPPP